MSSKKKTSLRGKTFAKMDQQNKTNYVYNLAKRWLQLLTKFVGLVGPSIIFILLGINQLPQSIPLATIVQQHKVASLVLGSILALMTLIAFLVTREPAPDNSNNISAPKTHWSIQWWMLATTISTVSFLISSTLLGVVLFRPSWCPVTLCPSSDRVVTGGVHDANLEIYVVTQQSSWYIIPGDPTHYSPSTLPETINAQSTERNISSSPYTIVLGVHSLLQEQTNILIEKVNLVIDQVPPMPRPLNVWSANMFIKYQMHPYMAIYGGQKPGEILPVSSTTIPPSHVELKPGEPDQIDVQVISRTIADIKFHVQVTYHIAGETQSHLLTFSKMFEVVFSDSSNWHEYQLQGGLFVAKP